MTLCSLGDSPSQSILHIQTCFIVFRGLFIISHFWYIITISINSINDCHYFRKFSKLFRIKYMFLNRTECVKIKFIKLNIRRSELK
jgi:hypothetical protein